VPFIFTPLALPLHHHEGSCGCVPTVGYIRVSRATGKSKIVSPEIQLSAIEMDARLNGRRIVDLRFDINKSGKSLDGRALHGIVKDIKDGLYHIVSVWKWSRWGRDTLDSLQMILAVDAVGGQVVSATEAHETKTPSGELVRDLMLVIATYQGKLIGEGWRDVHALRRSAGLPHNGRNRFGYQYIDAHYVIDDYEGPILKDTYERYIAGATIYRLTREFNERGLWTSFGGRWTDQSLSKMLDTGFGAGYIRERSDPSHKPANSIGNYDLWRKGEHDPIIDEETWLAYRARREARAATPVRLRNPTHILSGLMFCALCGRRISTKYLGVKAAHNWVCKHRAAYHPDLAVSVSNIIALGAMRDWVRKILAEDTHESRAAEVTAEARAIAAGAPKAKTDVDESEAELAKVVGRLRRLKIAYVDEGGDDLEFKRRKAELLADERTARADLARARAATTKTQGRSALIPAFTMLNNEWDQYPKATLQAMLAEIVGMVRVFPRASTRTSESALRVEVVPAWEMSVWGDAWLSERRRWQSSE